MEFSAAGDPTPFGEAQTRIAWYVGLRTTQRYDLGLGYQIGPADALIADDLRRTWWLRAHIANAHHRDWLDLAEEAPWAGLPAGAALAGRDEAQYGRDRAAAFSLFSHFYGVQRRRARVSKVLHIKRPAFFPVLDAVVLRLYTPLLGAPPTDGRLAQVPLVWDQIRADLQLSANEKALAGIREWIAEQAEDDPRYKDFLQLTDVRLFDIAVCWKRQS